MGYSDKDLRDFSQIAYLDLSDIYESLCEEKDRTSITLEEIKTYAHDHGDTKLEGKLDAYPKDWKIVGIHDTNKNNGFYCCVIETTSGNAAVAFRGSDDMGVLENTVHDWVEADIGLLNSTCTNQQEEVKRFLTEKRELLEGYENIELTGHSLGGNLAEYATIISDRYGLDDNIKKCVSLDGPGYSDEFIKIYRDEIEKMNSKMVHYRWSPVGSMLNDLPGVDYQQVKINYTEGPLLASIKAHPLEYLYIDEKTGSVETGASEYWDVVVFKYISRGIDHMPTSVGNLIKTGLGAILIGGVWVKDFVNDHPTIAKIIGGIAAGVALFNPVFAAALGFLAVKAIAALIIAATIIIVYEVARELILKVVDIICEAAKKIYNFVKDAFNAIRNAIVSVCEGVVNWFKNLFGGGQPQVDPLVIVDTYRLDGYANRIAAVKRRVDDLDRRINSLYNKVGLLDLWTLLTAGSLTSNNKKLQKCINYLTETSKSYESLEHELENAVS